MLYHAGTLFLSAVFLILMTVIIQRVVNRGEISREEQSAKAIWPSSADTTSGILPHDEIPAVRAEIAELLAENADAVGIVKFGPDTVLYVCQGEDNSYYASHRFDGEEDPAGMIYMDYRNCLWPRSNNIVLYGHNMRTGARFGKLKRFTDKKYLIDYPLFHLTDLYETLDYVPFAIYYTTVDETDPQYFQFAQIDFQDEAAFARYIAVAKEKSVFDIPVEVAYGDRLLTLATCASEYDQGRLVILCREVKSGENFW